MGHCLFGPTPTGGLSPFLRQTCLFLFFCESQQILHQHVPFLDFLRGAIFRSSGFDFQPLAFSL